MQSRFAKKQQQWSERKTDSVFNKRSKYNIVCLYIAAYSTPKEKTVVITHLHGYITINQTTCIVRF